MSDTLMGDAAAWAGMAMLGKTSAALLLIVGIILLCGLVLKQMNPQRLSSAQRLRVVASTSLGQRERVVILEVENTWLVLGVTGSQISKLHELPVARAALPAVDAPRTAIAERIERYLHRKHAVDGDRG